jgi:membrane protease YdiL (CAAX protease family)
LYAILLSPLLATGFSGIEFQADTLRIATFVILFHLTVVIHEEFYFRGIILSLFKHNLKKAVLISALLFGTMHFLNLFQVLFDNEIIFSGFFISTLLQVARTFGFGIIFAVIVIKTKSLMPVVLFHWIGNSFARIINVPSEFVLVQSVLYTVYGIVLLVVWFKKPK